ncbi:MAG: hypothetical protein AB1641_07825 [Thermodesulfobacteriota bacterium]
MVRRIFLITLILGLVIPASLPAASEDNIYLETIGAFSGSYIYTSYAYIGSAADAFAKDIYPASQIKAMMDEKVHILDNLSQMLQKVRSTNIADNDKVFLDAIMEILGLLKTEADALSAFATSKDPSEMERYDQARKKAWPKIKKLLGIN